MLHVLYLTMPELLLTLDFMPTLDVHPSAGDLPTASMRLLAIAPAYLPPSKTEDRVW